MKIRDYHNDLVYKGIKRLFVAEKAINRFVKSGGIYKDFDCLNLNADPPHPIVDYNEEEKNAFITICGEPLQFPDQWDSPHEFKKKLIKRREYYRTLAGLIDHHRWLGPDNYLTKHTHNTRFTGRLVL